MANIKEQCVKDSYRLRWWFTNGEDSFETFDHFALDFAEGLIDTVTAVFSGKFKITVRDFVCDEEITCTEITNFYELEDTGATYTHAVLYQHFFTRKFGHYKCNHAGKVEIDIDVHYPETKYINGKFTNNPATNMLLASALV